MFTGLLNVSEGELLLIALAALLLFGSKGLPDLLRSFGRGIAQIRQASENVRYEIRRSMYEAEMELQRRKFEIEKAVQSSPENPCPNQIPTESSNKENPSNVPN
ncbi:MAG: twin-arginine translocase TatA/TatE family subunit [Flavobacteriales bacterium]|nr:twin-arginine translocase TatA/TatE family subunit [Flavobacteriales bacterium]MCX7768262.1 twin-arginine translocase TatA/TatE family subunit [Flavobacteriales bacterium]MDW8410584.1 twin-arginine translocase TatA/TatE family subunit [Flavobacteriales bacterium]